MPVDANGAFLWRIDKDNRPWIAPNIQGTKAGTLQRICIIPVIGDMDGILIDVFIGSKQPLVWPVPLGCLLHQSTIEFNWKVTPGEQIRLVAQRMTDEDAVLRVYPVILTAQGGSP